MRSDLLRQLDAYGDHVETLIRPVDIDEIERVAATAAAGRRERRNVWAQRRRTIITALGAAGVIALIVFVASTTSAPVSSNFDMVGDSLDGGSSQGGSAGGGDVRRSPSTAAPPTTAGAIEDPGIEDQVPDARTGREIIFIARMSVAVSDAGGAAEQAILAVESLGGFLSGERSTGGADAESLLVFKVPSAVFQEALDLLGDIGVVTDREVTAEDVTERIVDLESQVASAEVSVERLRTFLAEAASVEAIAQLEQELTDREGELERLRGRLETLGSRVALATIRLKLTEAIPTPEVRLQTGSYATRDDDGAACMGSRPLAVESDTVATVCIQIANSGRSRLTDVRLAGPALDLFAAPPRVIEGTIDGILEPGAALVLVGDLLVTERVREDLTVRASPVDETGDARFDRSVTATNRVIIDIDDPDELPGFGDAWEGGVEVLATTGGIALLIIGAVLPWLWLPALIAVIVWWRRRR